MALQLGSWDVLLIVMVSLQATVLAYLPRPQWKAILLLLPLPFTIATMALARPVEAQAALGLIALLAFTHLVRYLHCVRVPIILAIVLSALAYCVLGYAAERFVPHTPGSFWASIAVVLVSAITLHLKTASSAEPDHRTDLPLFIKLPLVVAVVVALVMAKHLLGAFMTTFPMVGVIAAYEMRKSLWTNCRAIPLTMLVVGPMLIVARLVQPLIGVGGALAAAWIVPAVIAPFLLMPFLKNDVEAQNALL